MTKRMYAVLSLLPAILAAQPNLQWATRVPASSRVTATAMDAEGNTWIGGTTVATDLPVTTGAIQRQFGGGRACTTGASASSCPDGFLMKFSKAGALLYATYLGGPNSDEVTDLAVDAAGSVYVLGTGFPLALNYPVRGQGTGVVAKLSGNGALQWASNLGLAEGETARRIAVGRGATIFIAGTTASGAIPTTPAALRRTRAVAGLLSWNGTAWAGDTQAPEFDLLAADAGNARVLWGFVRANRTLWRSLNSGGVWTLMPATNLPDGVSMIAAQGNTILAVGEETLRSVDGGQNFSRIMPAVAPTAAVAFDGGRAGVAYAAAGGALLRTTDNGETWALQRGGGIYAVATSGAAIYALDNAGGTTTLLSSRDGGATWDSVAVPNLSALAGGPQNRLYGLRDTLVYSADGGRTWVEETGVPYGVPAAFTGTPAALYARYAAASDVFLIGLGPSGTTLEFSTLYGGAGAETVLALAVDDAGQPVLAGVTRSADLPVAQAAQAVRGGGEDGYIAQFSSDGARLVHATLLGGATHDAVASIAPLAPGNLAYGGWTAGVAAERPPLERSEGWVRRLRQDGTAPATLATFPRSRVQAVAEDGAGNLWSAAETAAQGLATADAWQAGAPGGSGDVLLSRVRPDGGVAWATYFGGSGDDSLPALAAAGTSEISLATSSVFVPLSHPIATTGDAVLSRWSADALRAPTLPENAVVNAGSYRPALQAGGAVAPGAIVAIFGEDLARGVTHASTIPLPADLLGTTVTVNGVAAPLFYVSPQQVNAQIPFEVRIGTGLVQVRRNGVLSAERRMEVVPVSVGLWNLTINPVSGAVNPTSLPAGGRLLLYATGLGALERPVATGTAATTANRATTGVTARLEGIPLTVEYAGAAPGFVGLYQINIVLPASPVEGTLVVSAGGFESNGVYVRVQ